MATTEAPKKKKGNEASPIQRLEDDDDATADSAFTAVDGIRKLQEGKAGAYGLYLDPDHGYEMVRIVKEEEGMAHLRLSNDTAIVVPAKQITRLDPTIAHFVRQEQAKDPFESTTELANLRVPTEPAGQVCRQAPLLPVDRGQPMLPAAEGRREERPVSPKHSAKPQFPGPFAVEEGDHPGPVRVLGGAVQPHQSATPGLQLYEGDFASRAAAPGFVSIQPVFGADTYSNTMYWVTFATVVSGLITSYISLFKLDKKFYSTTHAYLRLESEGWAYITLTGKYGRDPETGIAPTHDNRFHHFCNEVEQIRQSEMKVDMIKTGTAASNNGASSQDGTTRRR